MKQILFTFLIICAFFLAGAEFASEWNVKLLDNSVKELPILFNEKTDLPGRNFKLMPDKDLFSVDIAKLTDIKPDGERFAIVTGEILSDRDGTILLGAGADYYYMLFVNGKCVSSTMHTGNSAYGENISSENQMQLVELRKGRNPVRILLRSGGSGFLFIMAPKPLSADRVRKLIPAVGCFMSPVLTLPGTRSVALLFRTEAKVYAELEYRESSSGKWRKVLSSEDYAGVYPSDRLYHRFILKDLVPGKKYEFRTLLIARNSPMRGPSGKFVFAEDSGKPFSFFTVSDTQYAPQNIRKDMQSYRENCKTDECSFFVHLGDVANLTTSYEKQYFEPFFDVFNSSRENLKPFVLVRGNHDLRGSRSSEWVCQFGTAARKGYYAFRYGKYCFIVLDTCEDKDYSGRPEGPLFLNIPQYLDAERKWLAEYVKSDEFKTAEYRIVFSHAFPHIAMAGSVERIAGGILFGKNAYAKIHLWMSGHTHRYQRTVPGSDECFIIPKRLKGNKLFSAVDPKLVPFTVVVSDGPNLFPKSTGIRVDCGDTIRVSACIPDGSLLDRFEIGKDGQVLKSEPSEKLKKFRMEF